jgi:hypothetical protein
MWPTKSREVEELLLLSPCELADRDAGVVEDDVVLEGLGQVVVARLGELEHGLFPLTRGEPLHHREPAVLLLLQHDRARVLP